MQGTLHPGRGEPFSAMGLSIPQLSSPLIGTFYFNSYPLLERVVKKLRNCGTEYVEVINEKTGDIIKKPVYCDNRVCPNPGCIKHRKYKFLTEHKKQIDSIEFSILKGHRTAHAYIFTDGRYEYPIDKKYCQNRLKLLYRLLLAHSKTKFSIHMEIKPLPIDIKKGYENETYYLHFHGVSGFIDMFNKDLGEEWGKVIRFEKSRSLHHTSGYVSKYASKVPKFPSVNSFMEYLHATYKLQMHRFSPKNGSKIPSNWKILSISGGRGKNTWGENFRYLINCGVNDGF